MAEKRVPGTGPTRPKASTTKGKSSIKLKPTPLELLVMVAGAAVRNPAVQSTFKNLSGDLASTLKDRKLSRKDEKRSTREKFGGANRFGHAGLDLRAGRLGSLVAGLGTNPALPPEARQALDDFQRALNLVNLRLQVATALPWSKRFSLHREIGSALDELETILSSFGRPIAADDDENLESQN